MISHDCVVVPGWGALIAQYSDSFYSEADGIISKPQRKVGFNSSVNHNDGLLAQSIVRREGISYDEAVRYIADSVTTFKQQLNAGNEVSLGRLGFFHSNDGLIDFIPFYHETSNDEYFGLRSVNFKTLAQLRQEQEAAQEQPVVETVVVHTSWARRAMQIAASIVVLLALVPVLTTPILKDSDSTLASLKLPEVKQPARTTIFSWDSAQVDLAVAIPEQEIETQQAIEKRLAKVQKMAADEAKEKVETSFASTSGSGRYYLIISSLSTEKQVKEYLGSHKDMQGKMHVLKRGNKYRIYVARDNNANKLYKIKHELPERYHDAWVCD